MLLPLDMAEKAKLPTRFNLVAYCDGANSDMAGHLDVKGIRFIKTHG
jgi:hypothetical protein